MSALEDRLRRDLGAESGQITPDSLPDLRLPGPAAGPAGHSWLARPWRKSPRAGGAPLGVRPPWLAWAKPLAAAAAVIAVIAGALALSRVIQAQPPVAGIPPDYSTAPDYYAYTVQGDIFSYVSHGTQSSSGVQGRYIKVRATSTGKLLASVSPPKPYNDFNVITGAANGRVFVFGAMRFWQRHTGPSPQVAAHNLRTPMVFLLVRISAGGHAHISTLSLPETLTPGQGPSIALPRTAPGSQWPSTAGRARLCRSSRSAPARFAPGSSRGPLAPVAGRAEGLDRERAHPHGWRGAGHVLPPR